MNLNSEKGKLFEITNNFVLNSCKLDKNSTVISSILYKDEGDNYCIYDNDYSIRLIFIEDHTGNLNIYKLITYHLFNTHYHRRKTQLQDYYSY